MKRRDGGCGHWVIGWALVAACGGGGPPPEGGPPAGTGGGETDGTSVTPWAPPADDEMLVESTPAPVPISGGTLLVTRSGEVAWAANPDADYLWKIDLAGTRVETRVELQPGDEPGRIAEDDAGRIHVALRRGDAIATLEPGSLTVERRPVCTEPRGIAFDGRAGVLHVACASGELVTLPAAGGPPLRRLDLGGDLRDVIVLPDGALAVTRFREASLTRVEPDGRVGAERRSGRWDAFAGQDGLEQQFLFDPAVGWRAVAMPGDAGVAMVHQRERVTSVDTHPGGYIGDGCDGGILHTAVTVFGPGDDDPRAPQAILRAGLPVDLAVSPDGKRFAIAAAAARAVVVTPREASALAEFGGWCELDEAVATTIESPGTPVAVAYDAEGRLLTQTRGPAFLEIREVGGRVTTIPLAGPERPHTGHDLFHATSATVACASCHPEGREDGHVWNFSGDLRRTQTTAGGVSATAPFHWSGDMPDLEALSTAVFVRLGRDPPAAPRLGALARWVDTIPPVRARPSPRPDLAERGRELFESAAVGCASCHAGPMLTNNEAADVGTGGSFQVPSLLGLAARAPFLHDGRAGTLLEAFQAGSATHGDTSALGYADIDAIVWYLQTL